MSSEQELQNGCKNKANPFSIISLTASNYKSISIVGNF